MLCDDPSIERVAAQVEKMPLGGECKKCKRWAVVPLNSLWSSLRVGQRLGSGPFACKPLAVASCRGKTTSEDGFGHMQGCGLFVLGELRIFRNKSKLVKGIARMLERERERKNKQVSMHLEFGIGLTQRSLGLGPARFTPK